MAPEILYGIGAILLAIGIIYAVMRNKGRDRRNDRITDQATREIYRQDPETYSAETRPELDRRVKR
jgi:hypothetical protein